jgi:hypothetical protein
MLLPQKVGFGGEPAMPSVKTNWGWRHNSQPPESSSEDPHHYMNTEVSRFRAFSSPASTSGDAVRPFAGEAPSPVPNCLPFAG